jgi:hypothetical protein
MEEQIKDTWASRDLPILRAALRRLDAGEDIVDFIDLQRDTGLSTDELWTGLHALRTAQPPYLELTGRDVEVVTERARRELGSWPSADSLVDALAAAFVKAAEAEAEPRKKQRLRTIGEGLAGAARDIAIGVLTKKIGDI